MNSQIELLELALPMLSKALGRRLDERDVDVKYTDVNIGIIILFEKRIKKYYKFIPQPGGECKIIQL